MLSLLAGFFQTRHLYSGWDPALCQTKNTLRNRESRSDRPRNKENGERYRLLLSTLLTATLNVTVIMTCDLDFQLPASYGHDPCTWKNQSEVSQFKSHGENKYEHDRIAFSSNEVGNYFNHSFSTPGCCESYKFCCCFLFTYLFLFIFSTVSIRQIVSRLTEPIFAKLSGLVPLCLQINLKLVF